MGMMNGPSPSPSNHWHFHRRGVMTQESTSVLPKRGRRLPKLGCDERSSSLTRLRHWRLIYRRRRQAALESRRSSVQTVQTYRCHLLGGRARWVPINTFLRCRTPCRWRKRKPNAVMNDLWKRWYLDFWHRIPFPRQVKEILYMITYRF